MYVPVVRTCLGKKISEKFKPRNSIFFCTGKQKPHANIQSAPQCDTMLQATTLSIDALFTPLLQAFVASISLATALRTNGMASIFWYCIFTLIVTLNLISQFNRYYKLNIFCSYDKRFQIKRGDIVLILGGSRGLGLEILRNFLAHEEDVKVCLVDIVPFDTEQMKSMYDEYLSSISQKKTANTEKNTYEQFIQRLVFFQCDASDEQALLKVIKKVECEIGPVRILINNVGVKHNETFHQLTYKKIKSVLQTNLFSYILAMKLILKLRLASTAAANNRRDKSRLFIVNVASVLGLIAPANLSVYSASKSAIIAIHESIIHEFLALKQLQPNLDVHFLLVKLGQLDTLLFNDVKPPKPFLAPVLSHKKVADQIYANVKHGVVGEITLPLYGKFVSVLRALPFFLVEWLRNFSEMDKSVQNEPYVATDINNSVVTYNDHDAAAAGKHDKESFDLLVSEIFR